MALTWVSADLRTGRVLADLPGLACDYPLRRTIGAYDTATAHLALDGAPPDWEYVTREGGALLAAYDDDNDDRPIVWAGFVTQQVRNTDDDAVTLALATAEAYLDRRYVGTMTYATTGQNTIVTDLIQRFVVDGAEPGIPITVQALDGQGVKRDRRYMDADNTTVYTRLSQLMAAEGGPEFTIEWSWSNNGQSIVPTLIIGARLGTPKPADLPSPHVTFEMPGSVLRAEQTRDYSSGKGANKVRAYSSGQGDAAPTSGPPLRAVDDGRPTFEYRWSPSTSITDVSTLQDYARRALAILAPGARAITLTTSTAAPSAPRLGSAVKLGDDVGYRIGGIDDVTGRDTVPMFPGGVSGVGRVIAYELTETTWSPILAEVVVPSESDPTSGG